MFFVSVFLYHTILPIYFTVASLVVGIHGIARVAEKQFSINVGKYSQASSTKNYLHTCNYIQIENEKSRHYQRTVAGALSRTHGLTHFYCLT